MSWGCAEVEAVSTWVIKKQCESRRCIGPGPRFNIHVEQSRGVFQERCVLGKGPSTESYITVEHWLFQRTSSLWAKTLIGDYGHVPEAPMGHMPCRVGARLVLLVYNLILVPRIESALRDFGVRIHRNAVIRKKQRRSEGRENKQKSLCTAMQGCRDSNISHKGSKNRCDTLLYMTTRPKGQGQF